MPARGHGASAAVRCCTKPVGRVVVDAWHVTAVDAGPGEVLRTDHGVGVLRGAVEA